MYHSRGERAVVIRYSSGVVNFLRHTVLKTIFQFWGVPQKKHTPAVSSGCVLHTPGTSHFWDVPSRFLGFSGWDVALRATPQFWSVAARKLNVVGAQHVNVLHPRFWGVPLGCTRYTPEVSGWDVFLL